MSSFRRIVLMVAFWLGVAAGGAIASPQSGAIEPPSTVPDQLQAMSAQAGVIFAGEVVAVRPPSPAAGQGWAEVEFRIDVAVRGCAGQPTYVLREWAGLWAAGTPRYTAGQHLLMMLHTPSASGLTSPVGGQDGVMPIVGRGPAPGPEDDFAAASEPVVDTRWVEARLLRTTSKRLQARPVAPIEVVRPHGQVRMMTRQVVQGASALSPEGSGLASSLDAGATTSPAGASQGISLRTVLAMFGAWQAEQANATH